MPPSHGQMSSPVTPNKDSAKVVKYCVSPPVRQDKVFKLLVRDIRLYFFFRSLAPENEFATLISAASLGSLHIYHMKSMTCSILVSLWETCTR
jgi:hypothetical protein